MLFRRLTDCTEKKSNIRFFSANLTGITPDEAHFSAVRGAAQTNSRVSRAHAHAGWSRGDPRAPGQGSGAACRLTGRRRFTHKQRLDSPGIAALLAGVRPKRGIGVSVQTKANEAHAARLGLIVPKRILDKAVDRNRAKRLLREWFRLHQDRLAGRDVLVRVIGKPTSIEGLVVEVDRLLAAIA